MVLEFIGSIIAVSVWSIVIPGEHLPRDLLFCTQFPIPRGSRYVFVFTSHVQYIFWWQVFKSLLILSFHLDKQTSNSD